MADCLGGNSKTIMLATLNSSIEQAEHTKQSLEIATQTMNVINTINKNGYEIIESTQDVANRRNTITNKVLYLIIDSNKA